MPRYSYKAYDAKGGAPRRRDRIGDARSRARGAWCGRGATRSSWWKAAAALPRCPGGSRRCSPRAACRSKTSRLLTRELATLIKAELPIDEALRIVVLQPLISARTRQVVAAVLARVLDGASLSEALGAQQGAFPEYYWRIVHAGEASGTLGPALDDLAHLLDRAMEFRSRIVSALVYPATLLDRGRRGPHHRLDDPHSRPLRRCSRRRAKSRPP